VPYIFYALFLVSVLKSLDYTIIGIFVADTFVVYMIFYLIYQRYVLPLTTLREWLEPNILSLGSGFLVIGKESESGGDSSLVGILLDVYNPDRMAGIRSIILIHFYVQFALGLYRSLAILLLPLFLQLGNNAYGGDTFFFDSQPNSVMGFHYNLRERAIKYVYFADRSCYKNASQYRTGKINIHKRQINRSG